MPGRRWHSAVLSRNGHQSDQPVTVMMPIALLRQPRSFVLVGIWAVGLCVDGHDTNGALTGICDLDNV